jgi:hypothetical protein
MPTHTHTSIYQTSPSAAGRSLSRFTTHLVGFFKALPVHYRLIIPHARSFTLCPSTNAHTHPTTAPARKTASRHRTFATPSTISDSVPAFFLLRFLSMLLIPLKNSEPPQHHHSQTQQHRQPPSSSQPPTHSPHTHIYIYKYMYTPVNPQIFNCPPNQHSNPLLTTFLSAPKPTTHHAHTHTHIHT